MREHITGTEPSRVFERLKTSTGSILSQLFDSDSRMRKYYFLLFAVLYLVTSYYLIRSPIVAGDTDLWYHLNGGRYIVEHKSLPYNSFFSFLSPPRNWVDYYWLFQVVVYKIYSVFDYHGLILLRAILYLLTVSVIFCFLFGKGDAPRPSYQMLIFLLYFLFVLPRYLLVRPHTFSYLFIVAFLYILELRPKRAMYLPLLGVLWTNLHGVEYPVMLLITFSYLVTYVFDRLKQRNLLTRDAVFSLSSIVLCMSTIYLTPHGLGLIKIPFISTGGAPYTGELRPLDVSNILSFKITTPIMAPTHPTIINVLLLTACLAGILSLFKKNIRIHHFLMFAGGIFLLTKGERFSYEFVLLALPLIKANPVVPPLSFSKKIWRPICAGILGLSLAMSLMFVAHVLDDRAKYPFSAKNLPHGVSIFLNRLDVSGTVLNHPNKGGYLQWMLYPKYQIFTDMQALFTAEDFYIASNAFQDGEVLRKVISRYDPSFIAAHIRNRRFKEVVKRFPEYVVVFFDDSEVLYVNKRKHPVVAENFALKGIDPFELIGKTLDAVLDGEAARTRTLDSLLRLIEIYPGSALTNQIVAMIHNRDGAYDRAMRHADAIIRNHPELPVGYWLRADSLRGLKVFDEAISYYELALRRSDEVERRTVYSALGSTYMELQQYDKAYQSFKQVTKIFSPDVNYKELYDLGSSAFHAGRHREAATIFRFAYKKVPREDSEWHEKYEQYMSRLGIATGE